MIRWIPRWRTPVRPCIRFTVRTAHSDVSASAHHDIVHTGKPFDADECMDEWQVMMKVTKARQASCMDVDVRLGGGGGGGVSVGGVKSSNSIHSYEKVRTNTTLCNEAQSSCFESLLPPCIIQLPGDNHEAFRTLAATNCNSLSSLTSVISSNVNSGDMRKIAASKSSMSQSRRISNVCWPHKPSCLRIYWIWTLHPLCSWWIARLWSNSSNPIQQKSILQSATYRKLFVISWLPCAVCRTSRILHNCSAPWTLIWVLR